MWRLNLFSVIFIIYLYIIISNEYPPPQDTLRTMMNRLLNTNKNLNTFLPRNRIVYGVVGSTVALTIVLNSMLPKPKLKIDTLSPEWKAATKDYRDFQKMDDVYD